MLKSGEKVAVVSVGHFCGEVMSHLNKGVGLTHKNVL